MGKGRLRREKFICKDLEAEDLVAHSEKYKEPRIAGWLVKIA